MTDVPEYDADEMIEDARRRLAAYEAHLSGSVPENVMQRVAAQREGAAPIDPLSLNHLDFAQPGGRPMQGIPQAPRPHKTRSAVPETEVLFSIQKDIMKGLKYLDELREVLRKEQVEFDHYKALRRELQNAYRSINHYLKAYAVLGDQHAGL